MKWRQSHRLHWVMRIKSVNDAMVRVHDKHSEVSAIVVVTSVDEDAEKFERLCTIDRNVK